MARRTHLRRGGIRGGRRNRCRRCRLLAGRNDAELIALMPLLLVIGVAVKLSSPGPVFFTQKRRGADGETVDIYKIRTMKQHVERDGTVVQATRNDPRVTAIGALLRRKGLVGRLSLSYAVQTYSILRNRPHAPRPRPS
ncbi:sugar transferase [Burkholderia ambifaria]|uniref:sugar transferase n=1 Tax=Burkholderia ambifaria TaxID=152480 RepID=UPI003C7C346F